MLEIPLFSPKSALQAGWLLFHAPAFYNQEQTNVSHACLYAPIQSHAAELLQILTAWQEQAAKFSAGEISREDYDQWRYNYPKFDTTQHWAKVPSQEFSDTIVDAFKSKLKTDDWKQVYYGFK